MTKGTKHHLFISSIDHLASDAAQHWSPNSLAVAIYFQISYIKIALYIIEQYNNNYVYMYLYTNQQYIIIFHS